jgi:uncharacterized tellurite resistance protein B-like protein
MGLKSSFTNLKTKTSKELGASLLKTKLCEVINEVPSLKNDNQKQILTAIIFSFTKASLIDREFCEREEKEIAKRVSRFINLKPEQLMRLINAAENELNSSAGRKSNFVATPYLFLAKKADEKTKRRLYRYLTDIVAIDSDVAVEEEYLLKLVGEIFGFSDKEIREYLLATELKTGQEELSEPDSDKPRDSFSSKGGEAPIIKMTFES